MDDELKPCNLGSASRVGASESCRHEWSDATQRALMKAVFTGDAIGYSMARLRVKRIVYSTVYGVLEIGLRARIAHLDFLFAASVVPSPDYATSSSLTGGVHSLLESAEAARRAI